MRIGRTRKMCNKTFGVVMLVTILCRNSVYLIGGKVIAHNTHSHLFAYGVKKMSLLWGISVKKSIFFCLGNYK